MAVRAEMSPEGPIHQGTRPTPNLAEMGSNKGLADGRLGIRARSVALAAISLVLVAGGAYAPGRGFDREDALAELTLRYLASHGPATVKDLAWWSGLTVADLKHALHLLDSEVKSETIDGLTFWSTAAEERRTPTGRGALLLHGYDELLVGYNQSRYFGDPREPAARKAWTDRGLPTGLVLLDARVYGYWRRTVTRDSVTVEVVSYEDPSPSALRALESAAGRLGRFLGLRAELEARRL